MTPERVAATVATTAVTTTTDRVPTATVPTTTVASTTMTSTAYPVHQDVTSLRRFGEPAGRARHGPRQGSPGAVRERNRAHGSKCRNCRFHDVSSFSPGA